MVRKNTAIHDANSTHSTAAQASAARAIILLRNVYPFIIKTVVFTNSKKPKPDEFSTIEHNESQTRITDIVV